MLLRISTAIGVAVLAPSVSSIAQEKTPEELYSPDQRYSVRIPHSALPGSDPDDGFFTIVVRNRKQYVVKYPTEGYLIDAFWSPDGRYVAVDNRRANSGDYLWVFRVRDGRAIKMPVDAQPQHANDVYEKYAKEVVHHVTAVYPELTYDQFRKLFVFAHGWTKTGELQVKTNLAFRNLENAIGLVWETYKIENDKLADGAGFASHTKMTAVYINGSNGQLGTQPPPSSRRFKKEIKAMDQTSQAILALKPVTFQYISDTKGTAQFGLIAEEVAEVNPDLVVRDAEGKIYTVRYEAVNAMLLNEFLKEHRKVEEQESMIAQLTSSAEKEEATITKLESMIVHQQKILQAAAMHQQRQIEALTSDLQTLSTEIKISKRVPQPVANDLLAVAQKNSSQNNLCKD